MDGTEVSCPNCSQPYSITSISPLKGRLPLLLSCDHSVCEPCITNITKFAEPYECKFCLQETRLEPNEVKNLADNPSRIREYFSINTYLLGDLVLQLQEKSSEYTPKNFYVDLKYILNTIDNNIGICVECKSGTPTMCKQCGSVLCDLCFEKIHKPFLSFRNHVIQNITVTSEPNYCEIHKDKSAEYYCTECSKCICVDCMIVGGAKSCKNHIVVSVQEKNPQFLEELKTLGPKVDETYRRLTNTALNVGHLLENLNSDKSEKGITKLVNDIKTHFAKLHAQVQKNEDEVLKTIRALKQSEQNSLLGIKANIEGHIKKAKETLNKINIINDEASLNINVYGLLESAKNVLDMPWYIPKEDISPPKLTINGDIYELLTNCITLERNAKVEYRLLATKDIENDVEIPAAPSAPVFPPEIIRDVRETNKPKSTEVKKHKISTQPPKYRSKCGSSSSSSVGVEQVSSKSLQLEMPKNDDQFQAKISSTDVCRPRQFSEGTQDLVFISHIHSPNNFFVQRASQQGLVRDIIREFRKSSNFPQPSLKQLHEGKILLVYDGKEKAWHRCRILHIEAKDNMEPVINILCLDFGNIENVKIEELRLIPPAKAQNPPPLAVRCSLANCQPLRGWTSEDTMLMQNIIDNKQIVIYIRRINFTDKYDLTLECDVTTFDNAVNLALAFVFQERARLQNPKLHYPVLRNLEEKPKIFYSNNDFQLNTVEEVQITHIISPDKFYIRKCYLQDTFDKLCESLNNTYSSPVTTGNVYCPTQGMVCIVNLDKYTQQVSTGGWQRAVVREAVGRGRVQLALVDTGETVVVHWSALRYIKPEFTKYRALAVECHLSGITPLNKRWSTDSLALLESFRSKVLKMEVADSGQTQSSIAVNLYYDAEDEKICVNTEMIHHKHAISIGTYMFTKSVLKETPVHTTNIPIDNKSRPKPKKNKIAILKRNESLADHLNENLEAKDKGPIKLEVKILSYKSPSLIHVSLVDQQKQFRDLFESIQIYYTKNKTQAKTQWNVGERCCTICTDSRTWRRAAILEINEDSAKVFYIDFATVESVPLERLRELPEEFIKMGGAVVTCHLSGIMPAVGDEWPSITKEYLKELIDAYQRFFITKNGTIKDKSLPVELWVYHITQGGPLEPNHAEWRCLNKKIIEQGLAIPEKSDTNLDPNNEIDGNSDDVISFLNITGSISEWLQIETFADEASSDLPATVSGNCSIANANSPKKTKKYSTASEDTTLQTDEEKSSAAQNRGATQSQKILDWLPPEDLTRKEFTGVPTYIDNDAVIYLYDICQQEDLDVMRETLDECFKKSVAKTADTYWSVGQPCIARFYLDEKFYRGRVVAINDENKTCLVHYVDYGNEEMCSVSDMRKRLILWKLPIQGHKCILSRVRPISGQWERQTLDFIHKMIVEKNCLIKITGEKVDELTPIDLKVGQLWLSEHLVDIEKAEFADGSKVILPEFVTLNEMSRSGANSPPNSDSSPEYIVEGDISDQLNESKVPMLSSNIEGNQVTGEETEPEETVFVYSNIQINDDEFMCTVSTIYNDQFELILKNDKNSEDLEKMHKEIEESVDDLPGLSGVYEKKACVALFKGDDKWYRASILQYSEKKGLVKVKYVDFGDIAIVHISDIKETLEKWTVLPAIAVSAKIYGVSYTGNCDIEELESTFMKKEFYARLVKREDDIIYVELRNEKEGALAYQNLIEKNIFVEEET